MKEKILILCKTYPHPSESYLELTCVAGIKENGELVRIYPVPFRHLAGEQKFKKWQWIEADTAIAKNDSRKESRKIPDITTIKLLDFIGPDQGWYLRKQAINAAISYTSYDSLMADFHAKYISLALLKPLRIIDLQIEADKKPNWTEQEIAKLKGDSRQTAFDFQDDSIKLRESKMLEKIPFVFRYIYEYEHEGEIKTRKTIIKDWEAAALYRNCVASHGKDWQKPFRQKLLTELSQKDMTFLMGNIGSVPKQWMIISLIYPPKPECLSLF